MPDTIQPCEYSRGSGKDGVLYITDSDGNLNVFNVKRNDDGLWLNANYANPDNHWNGDNLWVFRRPQLTSFLSLIWESFVF